MRRFWKALTIVGLVLLALIIIVVGIAAWFVRRPWPQTKGTIHIDGMAAAVQVIRDKWGVPHIYAENEHDLFFAQGYVHAQDRLWQMEFNRRLGSGTLSEILGDATLDVDRFIRTIGLRRAAEKDLALLDADSRAVLEAYSQGVNAYIDTHSNRLPVEFTFLGARPAPWTPLDTLTWGQLMAYNLCGNYDYELLRARIIADLGEEAAQQLIPPYPADGTLIVPSQAQRYTWLEDTSIDSPRGLDAVVGSPRTDRGSNSWVVSGSRTATGKPMLADDTHLDLDMPSIWYENGLHGGRFDVVGYSFPGAPLVIIGHNNQIAWAVTTLPADVQDLYIERLNDRSAPTQYEYLGQWQELEIVPETILVKGQDPVKLDVRITRHGPIMNDVIGDLKDAEPLALHWTALDGIQLYRAVLLLNQATNWDGFRQALSFWDAPSQNFLFADLSGNIGYQSPGRIPIRAPGHQGTVPVPGWTGEYEWQGFIPFEELPSSYNPATGFIVTANNKVVPDSYPHQLAYEWAAPYRAQRIADMLAADSSITVDDMRAIQAQTYSLPAEALRPYLLAVQPASDLQARALELVRAWDLRSEIDRAGASVFQVWLWLLVKNTLHDEMGDELLEDYLGASSTFMPVLIDWMAQPANPWFDDTTTPEVEDRDDIVSRSFTEAVDWLSRNYGDEPDRWQWGRLHTKTFIHQPLGQSGIGLIEKLFNYGPIPARGDGFTVDAAPFSYVEPFAMRGGVSQRMIVDLSDWSLSLAIHTTGQSGQLFHPHRQDFVSLWQNVDYHPMIFTREAAQAESEGLLTLAPH